MSIFDEFAGQVKDTNPFRVMISELCENVLAHSQLISPGYVCARVLENSMKAEIAIADTGVGIEQSYLNGTNADAIERIRKGASAIEIAIDGLNSSKPSPPAGTLRSYYGFGLLITRKLVEENRGQILILSGANYLHLDRYSRRTVALPQPWHGTFIAIVLDLGNPLPLDKIYQETEEQYVGPSTKLLTSAEPPPKETTHELLSAPVSPGPKEQDLQKPQQEMPVKKLELRHYGTEILTRDAGTVIRADIAGYLAAGYLVELSLDGVSDITPSVADEAFAKIAEVVGHSSFEERVRFVGGTQLARRLIEFVLKTRQSKS